MNEIGQETLNMIRSTTITWMYALAITNALIYGTILNIGHVIIKVTGDRVPHKLLGPAKDMVLGFVLCSIMTLITIIFTGMVLYFDWSVKWAPVMVLLPSLINWASIRWMRKIEKKFWEESKRINHLQDIFKIG